MTKQNQEAARGFEYASLVVRALLRALTVMYDARD
jgi:hypothetical protein